MYSFFLQAILTMKVYSEVTMTSYVTDVIYSEIIVIQAESLY